MVCFRNLSKVEWVRKYFNPFTQSYIDNGIAIFILVLMLLGVVYRSPFFAFFSLFVYGLWKCIPWVWRSIFGPCAYGGEDSDDDDDDELFFNQGEEYEYDEEEMEMEEEEEDITTKTQHKRETPRAKEDV